jgi:DUF3040 family protein
MLSSWEARALRSIEQGLHTDDPGFAAMTARISSGRPSLLPGLLRAVVIAVAVLLASVCMVVVESGAGLVAVLFVCFMFGLRAWLPRCGRLR